MDATVSTPTPLKGLSLASHCASSTSMPVVEAMAAALDLYGNPSSVHSDGRRARRAIEEAGRRLGQMLLGLEGAHPFYVSIFGGVEHLRDFAPQCFDTEV